MKIPKHLWIFAAFAVIATREARSDGCDLEKCNDACNYFQLKGVCDGGQCKCDYGEKCSAMTQLPCYYACKQIDLEGECDDDGQCVCKAGIEFCEGILGDCQESCEEDPRSKDCLLVTAISCIKYGPVELCGCMCYTRLTEILQKRSNYTVLARKQNRSHYFVSYV